MSERHDPTGSVIFGALFALLGGLFLLNETTSIQISFRVVLPAMLIFAGLALIVTSRLR